MPRRRAAVGTVIVLEAWALLVAVVAVVAVLPLLEGWTAVAAQVGAYAALVVPALVLTPSDRVRLALTRRTAALGVALLVAAVLWSALVGREGPGSGLRHAVRAVSAGVGEEVLFRGAIHDRLEVLLRGRPTRAAVDAALFALFHLPVALRDGSPAILLSTLLVGAVLAGLREATGGIGLSAAVHVAIDLAG